MSVCFREIGPSESVYQGRLTTPQRTLDEIIPTAENGTSESFMHHPPNDRCVPVAEVWEWNMRVRLWPFSVAMHKILGVRFREK